MQETLLHYFLALCAQCHRGDQEGVAHRMSGPTLVGLLNWIIWRDWSSRQAEGKGLRTRFRWVEGARAWGGPEPIPWLLARPLWLGGEGAPHGAEERSDILKEEPWAME